MKIKRSLTAEMYERIQFLSTLVKNWCMTIYFCNMVNIKGINIHFDKKIISFHTIQISNNEVTSAEQKKPAIHPVRPLQILNFQWINEWTNELKKNCRSFSNIVQEIDLRNQKTLQSVAKAHQKSILYW